MRFRFFEYIFFVSTFGAITLFPFITPFTPLLRVAGIALLIFLTATSLILTLGSAWKNIQKKSIEHSVLTALIAGCTALFAGYAMYYIPPLFLGWGIVVCIATLTFGSILAHRFLNRIEKDFRRNSMHVILISLASNAILICALAFIATLIPPVAGILTALITLAALL